MIHSEEVRQVNQFLVLADALVARELAKHGCHVGHQRTEQTLHVLESFRVLGNGRILRDAAEALAEEGDLHPAQPGVGITWLSCRTDA